MRDRGGAERPLPHAANPHDGPVGSQGVHPHPAQIAGDAAAALRPRAAPLRGDEEPVLHLPLAGQLLRHRRSDRPAIAQRKSKEFPQRRFGRQRDPQAEQRGHRRPPGFVQSRTGLKAEESRSRSGHGQIVSTKAIKLIVDRLISPPLIIVDAA